MSLYQAQGLPEVILSWCYPACSQNLNQMDDQCVSQTLHEVQKRGYSSCEMTEQKLGQEVITFIEVFLATCYLLICAASGTGSDLLNVW